MQKLTTYNYYLSSKYRTSGIPANFNYLLKDPISIFSSPYRGEFRTKIKTICLPFSFNQLNALNNTTQYTITRGSTLSGSFSVAAGNYNVITFIQAWIAALQASVNALTGFTPNITYSYSSDRDIFVLIYTPDATITSITILNNAGYTQNNLNIGFSTSFTLGNVSITATSDQPANVSSSRCIYVLSNTLIQKNSYDAFVSQMRTSNVLESFPITTQPYSFITYEPSVPTESILRNNIIDNINISLQDENIDFSLQDLTLNWSLHLIFEHWINIDEGQSLPMSHFPVGSKEEETQLINANAAQGRVLYQEGATRLEEEKLRAIEDKNRLANDLMRQKQILIEDIQKYNLYLSGLIKSSENDIIEMQSKRKEERQSKKPEERAGKPHSDK